MVYESKQSQDSLAIMIRKIVEMITVDVIKNLMIMQRKGVRYRLHLCYEYRKPGYLACDCSVQKFGKGNSVEVNDVRWIDTEIIGERIEQMEEKVKISDDVIGKLVKINRKFAKASIKT
ncbi:4312_t:CDS:1, partial [Racocetra fulgida]